MSHDLNKQLLKACDDGNIELVKSMIADRNNNIFSRVPTGAAWEKCFFNACFRGHKDLVNLMIEKGNDNFNGGLSEACLGCKPDIAKMMINKGANDFNRGLINSSNVKCKVLEELMITKGATYPNCLQEEHEYWGSK